jgi:hypothetical protein
VHGVGLSVPILTHGGGHIRTYLELVCYFCYDLAGSMSCLHATKSAYRTCLVPSQRSSLTHKVSVHQAVARLESSLNMSCAYAIIRALAINSLHFDRAPLPTCYAQQLPRRLRPTVPQRAPQLTGLMCVIVRNCACSSRRSLLRLRQLLQPALAAHNGYDCDNQRLQPAKATIGKN